MSAHALPVSNGLHVHGVGIRTEKVFVTPQMAAKWLESNVDNRNVISSHLKSLQAAFLRDEVKLNGSTIKFSKSGRLLDGQHRLMACASTGVGFWTFVVYGLDDEVFETIDVGGVPRQVKDVLGIRGEANAPALAAALKVLHQFIEFGCVYDGKSGAFSVALAASLLERHPNIRVSVETIASGKNVLWRTSVASATHYLFCLSNQRLGREFATVMCEGANDIERPFARFRESLIRTSNMKTRLSNRVTAARAIKAFNAEVSGARPKLIVWKDTEDFPSIAGLDLEQL